MNNKTIATADLCDDYAEQLQISAPIWRSFGQHAAFHGEVVTVKCFEDNSKVKEQLATAGNGRVLVVDAGNSQRRAHLGDLLAQQAIDNGWVGVVVYGLIRDSAVIANLPIGVKAVGTHPLKTEKNGEGQVGITLQFANMTIDSGDYLYADEDGIIVAKQPVHF
ncbi:MAG: ribonuclease activity regulator protein RraA [Gammaproteobacteria bacterium]|nr:MAG: ribonuclease activity regulator protein RraA [Gammaproteobacteria bacterium]